MPVYELKNHPGDFAILAGGLALLFVVLFWFANQVAVQKIVLILMLVWYFVWGIWHHFRIGDLNWWVVAEYLSFVLFSLGLGLFLLGAL